MSTTLTIEGKEFSLPTTVTMVDKDGLYSVPLDLIQYAAPVDESNEFQWMNFRQLNKKGLDDESINGLMNSIKEYGLECPVICRAVVEGDELKLQLVEGERRIRSLNRLAEENKRVWSRSEQAYLPANEVYSNVPCRIVVANEEEAFQLAWSIQESTVDWGEGAKTRVVMRLRQAGYSNDQIMQMTKKTLSWIYEEEKLASLDDMTFLYYDEGKINRITALTLLNVDDVEKRHEMLEAGWEEAQKVHQTYLSQAEEEIKKAEDKENIAEAELALAEKFGDDDSVEDAKQKKETAKANTKKKKEKKKQLEKEGPKVKTKQLEKGAKKVTKPDEDGEVKSVVVKALSTQKLQVQYEKLVELNKNKGMVDDELLVEPEVLGYLVAVYKAILNREEDIEKVLMKELKKKKLLENRKNKQPVTV